jgi:hypothetical protein
MSPSHSAKWRKRVWLRRIMLSVAVAAAAPEWESMAQVPPVRVAAADHRHRRRAPAPAEPSTPPVTQANIEFTIDAPTPRGAWTMRIVNAGAVAVRLVADARFLSLDVTPLGGKHAERCELPLDMRPDPAERALVLLGGRAYVETFEPRLYCFAGRALDALAPMSTVVAHLGWVGRGSSESAISPIDGVEPLVASQKRIEALPIFLYDERSPQDSVAHTAGAGAPLVLDAPQSVEADSPDEVAVPLTLRNVSSRATLVRFRPDTVGFEVLSPEGREACTWPQFPSAPTPEVFTRLAPRGAASLSFEMAAYCDEHSLDRDGLLIVHPWLDTRGAGGQSIGLTAFSGVVLTSAPMYVRLHRGRQSTPRPPPQLAPQ